MTRYSIICPDCGYTATGTTQPRAEHGLRIHSCDRHRAREASKARRLAREAAVDKTPKPCLHKRAQHVHGSHACYVLDRCRCTDCTAANTAYERNRMRQHAYGRFGSKWVSSAPARAHVQHLMSQGLGLKRVVEISGYSQGAMTKLVYGSKGRQPTKRILREHADAILAVRATIDTLASGARVDGAGTRRRIQALIAIGWSQSKLARRLGYELRNFCYMVHGKRDVTAGTARKVRAVYDELWDQTPPQESRGDKGAYTRSLNYARVHGFVPPMAWDDETIDDPAAVPELGDEKRPGGKRVHVDDIADRLHVTADAIQQACRRAHRQDLVDQLGRNADLHRPGQANRKDKAA